MKQKCIKLSDELEDLLKKEKANTGKSETLLIREALERMFAGSRETVPDGTIIALNEANMAWARGACMKDGKTLNDIVNEIVEQARQV